MKPSGFGMLSVITVKFVVVAVLFTKQPVVSIVAFTLLQWSKYLSVIYMHRYFTTQQRMKWTHCVFKRRVSYVAPYTDSCLPHQKYMYNDNKPHNSNIQHQTNNYYKLIFLVSIQALLPVPVSSANWASARRPIGSLARGRKHTSKFINVSK